MRVWLRRATASVFYVIAPACGTWLVHAKHLFVAANCAVIRGGWRRSFSPQRRNQLVYYLARFAPRQRRAVGWRIAEPTLRVGPCIARQLPISFRKPNLALGRADAAARLDVQVGSLPGRLLRLHAVTKIWTDPHFVQGVTQ